MELTRLRWRMRGAWQWPSFAALTVADTVLLHELPIAGEGPGWFPALLLATFFNWLAVAVAGPLLGLLLRRRRPDLPGVVASDYGGTVALLATTAILVAIGLAHRPAIEARRDAFSAQSAAVRRWVATAPDVAAEFRRNIDRADSVPYGEHLYRTCIPADDGEHALCLFVDTAQSPPGIRVDSNRAPNDPMTSPGGP
ncbi:MAG TPA: hypothetical protein VFR97_02040 [Capillimicrobium sp.]|nr:hypothetical protein [Capillimicrobium sp.]